jgi:predicted outer membrane repeat protein
MVRLSSAFVLAALAGSALGQSINVDMNVASGSGAGAPVTSYGAALGQTGTWNAITPSSASGGTTVAVANASGVMTGVLLKHYASDTSGQGANGTGEFAKLMGDYAEGFGQNGQAWMEFTSLEPGVYRVWMYASLPPSQATYVDGFNNTIPHQNRLSISLNNVLQSNWTTQGVAPAGTFVRGTNYQVATVQITSFANTLKVLNLCDNTYFAAKCALNGIQLEKWTRSRIYVNDNATGNGSGHDWANAMTNLQTALDLAAKSNGVVQEIWVATGEYKPSTNLRSASFVIPSGLKMYGGFNGTETSLSQRQLTALGGGSSLNGALGAAGDTSDDSLHVVKVSDTNSATRLDGFVIAYGNADLSGDDARGGGIFGNNANLTIANCGIRYNSASVEGGGIYLAGFSAAKLVNVHIARNGAGSFGGGLRNTSSNSVGMVNCTFMENQAGVNGGGINSTGSFIVVHNSCFRGNTAAENGSGNGAGVYVFGSDADSIFRNCTFSFNRTVGGASGTYGGIGLGSGASTIVYNSILWWNIDGSVATDTLAGQVGGSAGTSITIADNIIEGATIFTGNRNVGLDPLFVDQSGPNNIVGDWDDDLRPAPGSPAIDTGNNSAMPGDQFDIDLDGNTGENLPFDILGQLRQTDDPSTPNTGLGSSPLVDRGAYEFQPPPVSCPADFNGDNQVDFFDYLDFAAAFDAEDPSADFNNDDQVDFFDYLDFAAAFDAGC